MSAYDRGGDSVVSLNILPKGLQFCFPEGSFSTSLKTVPQCQCFPGMQFTKRPVFGSESCRVHCRTKTLVPEVQKCNMAPRFCLQQYHCRKQHCPLALEIPAFPTRKVCTPTFPQSGDFACQRSQGERFAPQPSHSTGTLTSCPGDNSRSPFPPQGLKSSPGIRPLDPGISEYTMGPQLSLKGLTVLLKPKGFRVHSRT